MRKNLFIVFGVISFWSVLIGAAWAYLPLPLAAISAAVHSYGLVLTTAPILSAWSDCPGRLSLPGAINPFDFSLDRGRAWGGNTLASQITQPGSDFNISPLSVETWNGRGAGNSSSLVSYSSAAVSPKHSAEWCPNFAESEQGQPLHPEDGVTSEGAGGLSDEAMEMGEAELKKAGFTVVCESFLREREAG